MRDADADKRTVREVKIRPGLVIGALLVVLVLSVSIPEVRWGSGGEGLDTGEYANTQNIETVITTITSDDVTKDGETILQEADVEASISETRPLTNLQMGGYETTSNLLILDRELTDAEKGRVEADGHTLGERTTVAASLRLDVDDSVDQALLEKIDRSVGPAGADILGAYHVTRTDGKLDLQVADMLPEGVELQDVVEKYAQAWGLTPDQVEVRGL